MNEKTRKISLAKADYLFIFQLILLLFVTACHSPHSDKSSGLPSVVVADTLFEPTGNAVLDSLLQLTTTAKQDTSLALLYHRIARMYSNNDFEKAKEYYLKLRDLSLFLNWNEGCYRFATGYAGTLTIQEQYDSAFVINQTFLELAKENGDDLWTGTLTYDLGNIYFMKRWHESALACYMEALSIYEKIGKELYFSLAYTQLCQVHLFLNHIDKSIEYGEKAVALVRDAYKLTQLARAYRKKGLHEKAVEYLEESLRLCQQENDLYIMGIVYAELTDISINLYDLDKAKEYTHKADEICQELNIKECQCEVFVQLGIIEKLKGQFAQSETYIKEALQIAVDYDKTNIKSVCYKLLAELSLAQHKYLDNIRYWEEFDIVEESIARETSLRAAAEMEAKYETAKKQLEIERQQHIITNQNMQRWLLVVGVIILVVFLALLWYMLRLRIRRNLALTERNDALTERNDTLSEMNATKDKFFNIISHDLKNPTLALHDNLKLLVSHIRLWDVDTLSDFSNELLKSAEGQVELLNSLLNWARIQTGRITYIPAAFDLTARLRTDILLVRKLAEQKGVTLVIQAPDEALVTGDSNMLVTVVRNLLTNAIKFTAPGGTVTFSISPSVAPSPSVAVISVSDTGMGMTPEQIANLFRLDRPQTRRGTAGEEGSGLGLIVCKELLDKHGSLLHIESEEGKGSRFWFTV